MVPVLELVARTEAEMKSMINILNIYEKSEAGMEK